MRKLFYIAILFLFTGARKEGATTINPRSFYSEMKALEKPERVTAFAAVQTAQNTGFSVSSRVITVSSTTQNNLVVVTIAIFGTTRTLSSVTDNAGNTYELGSAVDNTNRLYQAYGVQTTGGATSITVTISGSATTLACIADEYSGFAAGNTNTTVNDGRQTGTGTGTSLSVSTLTPTATGRLIVASGIRMADGNTFTAGTDYTEYGNSTGVYAASEYRLSSASTETAPFTISSSGTWCEIANAFKDDPAAPTNTGGFFNFFKP